MLIRPRTWSLSRSSLVQTTVFWLSVPARSGMARVLRVIEIASENVRLHFISLPLVFRRRGGRKMLEHFVHAFAEVLSVLVRIIGERIGRRASPDQFLCFCVKEIDHQGPYFVRIDCSGCVAKSTESSPAAPSSEAVIERVQGLLILSCLNGKNLDVSPRGNQRPAFRGKSAIYRVLDPVDHERVFRLDLFPREGLVLAKVCTVVVIGFNVLSE